MPDSPPLEVELKLETTTDAMEKLLASPLLREHARSTIRSRQLVTTYYDTQDHRLGRRKLALRVRQNGRSFVQTLKTEGTGEGAATRRGEWEVELPDGTPRLAAFTDPAVRELTGLVLPDELTPVFETRFRRQALVVEWVDGSRIPAQIEVALDRGAVRAGEREAPIREVELELKQGDPRALFELAEAMHELVPLRLLALDKATRGYMLATDSPPPWRKARPVTLSPDMLVDDALQTVLGACLRHWIDNEAAARDGRDPEGLHQLRVALRRLRSAMSLFRPALGEEVRAGWNEELRWLLGSLGPARDLDVLASEIMAPVCAARPDDPALAAFAAAAAERRQEAQRVVREALASDRYGSLALRLACWVARRGWRQGADVDVLLVQRQPVAGFAAAILEKRHRRVRKKGRGFARLDPERRHELRIAFKKLRYGAEFFGSLFPEKRVERFRKVTARMQDILGHLNDVAVAERLARDVLEHARSGFEPKDAALGAGQVIGWHLRQAGEREPEAMRAWKAFRAVEPFWEN
ncbi:CHAD domain-containing protein [Benzoatithermus flavus]|uniref:CHAD domain-containing protein n=1 Tax=Benzoatithermus flavus TaxID=3108223 RepID=A0ABU8XMZ3_9PROT